MNLTIDIGNTSTKIALFDKKQPVKFYDNFDLSKIISLIIEKQVDKTIISSVKKDNERFMELIQKYCKIIELDHLTPLPIHNLYETPQTMGMDRLAAVVGANHLNKGKNCLVIDAGTCITVDFIDKKGYYQGGSISPGLNMKFKALHNFTDNLPLLKREIEEIREFELIGKNTHDAIRSGVINGTVAELEGIIRAYYNKYDDLKVVICGGNAKFFETKIKTPIFVIPELVLIGLNEILIKNA